MGLTQAGVESCRHEINPFSSFHASSRVCIVASTCFNCFDHLPFILFQMSTASSVSSQRWVFTKVMIRQIYWCGGRGYTVKQGKKDQSGLAEVHEDLRAFRMGTWEQVVLMSAWISALPQRKNLSAAPRDYIGASLAKLEA